MTLAALREPLVLLTVSMIGVLAVCLTIIVIRSVRSPAHVETFHKALDIIQGTELEIDTALNRSESSRRGWYEYWYQATTRSGRVPTDDKSPGNIAYALVVAGLVFGLIGWPGGMFGMVMMPVVALALYRFWLNYEASKRLTVMEKQLPQLLSGLRANLQTGDTAQRALVTVAADMPAPLGDELRALVQDLNVNVPLEAALHELARRVPSREFTFLIASLEIAVNAGEDPDPQLETIQDIVVQRTRIRQMLRAAVAQVRPTEYLAYLAVPLMEVFSMRDPVNREFWLGSGFVFLVVTNGLFVLGVVAIRLMVKSVENT